ncbi:MAG: hypothetical protein VKP63_07815 [Cyanobacteriota bacterium]|nr:hypothetical protein [Cyanobacteriota bacterium]
MAQAAGLAALDVTFNGGHFSGGEFLAESTHGGVSTAWWRMSSHYACAAKVPERENKK